MAETQPKIISLRDQLDSELYALTIREMDRPRTQSGQGDEIFGTANEYLQKLYVLRQRKRFELEALGGQARTFAATLQEAFADCKQSGEGMLKAIEAAKNPTLLPIAQHLAEIEKEMKQKSPMATFVTVVYTMELLNCFPLIGQKKVTMDAGWRIYHRPRRTLNDILRGAAPRGPAGRI